MNMPLWFYDLAVYCAENLFKNVPEPIPATDVQQLVADDGALSRFVHLDEFARQEDPWLTPAEGDRR